MKIMLNEDEKVVERVRAALSRNEGYCPCSFIRTDDTECMCREFREQKTEGYCHCKLYKKVKDDSDANTL